MSNEGERALRQAVRVRVVLRYVEELSLVLGASTLVPTLGAAIFGEFHLMLPYGGAGACLFGMGMLARRAPAPRDLQRNEALVVTAAVFFLSPIVMSGPLILQDIPWIDALFKAISGATTTGFSTLASVEEHSRTFLLARAWSPPRAPGRRGRHPPIPQHPDPFAAPLPRLRLRTAGGALRGRIGDGNRRPFGGNLAARARALSERCTLHQHATRAARGLCRPRGVVAANLDWEAQVL